MVHEHKEIYRHRYKNNVKWESFQRKKEKVIFETKVTEFIRKQTIQSLGLPKKSDGCTVGK